MRLHFRPRRSPQETSTELTYRLNDLAWLPFVGVVSTGVLQTFCIALAVLLDPNREPVFRRWVGSFNIWAGLTFMPAGFVVVFHTGPFAWNGVFAWWLLLVGFFTWVVVKTTLSLRNLTRFGSISTTTEAESLAHLA